MFSTKLSVYNGADCHTHSSDVIISSAGASDSFVADDSSFLLLYTG